MATKTEKIEIAVKILTDALSPEKDFFARIVSEVTEIRHPAWRKESRKAAGTASFKGTRSK